MVNESGSCAKDSNQPLCTEKQVGIELLGYAKINHLILKGKVKPDENYYNEQEKCLRCAEWILEK